MEVFGNKVKQVCGADLLKSAKYHTRDIKDKQPSIL